MTARVRSLLIVDDDAPIRDSFGDYFEDYGFRILSAKSGEAALQLMQSESPVAAIVDIRMGGISGADFIRGACATGSDCVFLICTGSPEYAIPDDLRTCRTLSPVVFRKPIDDLGGIRREMHRMIADGHTRG